MAQRIYSPESPAFEPLVRFNWGFWDARYEHQRGVLLERPDGLTVDTIVAGHFDRAYAEGYVRGWQDTDPATVSSEPAWQDYQDTEGVQ